MLAQLLLEAAILLLIVKLTRLLGGSGRSELLALSIASICPFLPNYSGTILTEVVATLTATFARYFPSGIEIFGFCFLGWSALLLPYRFDQAGVAQASAGLAAGILCSPLTVELEVNPCDLS